VASKTVEIIDLFAGSLVLESIETIVVSKVSIACVEASVIILVVVSKLRNIS